MSREKATALIAALILHYTIVLFFGLVLCDWGLIGSLIVGTFFLVFTTAVIGTGLVGPAAVVCMIIAGLGWFNALCVINMITAAGISYCFLSGE